MTDLSIDRPVTSEPDRGRFSRWIVAGPSVASSARDRRTDAGRGHLARDRGVLRAVRPAVGHRPGCVLLLVPAAVGSVHSVGLDRSDRVRLFAGVPPGDRAAQGTAVAAVHGGLDRHLDGCGVPAQRPSMVRRRVVLAVMELAGGNIHLLLAAAIVLGFRWPATWSLVLLTKVTPVSGCSGSSSAASGGISRSHSERPPRSWPCRS